MLLANYIKEYESLPDRDVLVNATLQAAIELCGENDTNLSGHSLFPVDENLKDLKKSLLLSAFGHDDVAVIKSLFANNTINIIVTAKNLFLYPKK
jgi:hypothetical protein